MASARRRVVLPAQPAGPGAAAEQSWSAKAKRAGEPRSGPLAAVEEAAAQTPAPARLSEGYLAATRQTAAAARARAASIRAAAQERMAMPGPERSRQGAAAPAGAMPPQRPPPAGAAVVAGSRGLSVAEAARASRLAFRPLRRSADPLLRQADPTDAGSPGVEQQPRFARTIAELERYQTASRWEDRGASIVPRPALARPDRGDAAAAPWSRGWARRKDPAAE
jgi:hypothetical protein